LEFGTLGLDGTIIGVWAFGKLGPFGRINGSDRQHGMGF
jgi:hypothetical protein